MTVGVVVSTNTRAGASRSPRNPESHTFIVVRAERGRTNLAVKCRNPQEYANEFGEWVSYGSGTDFVNLHFAEGGSEIYVARAVGPSATKGTLTLVNRAGSPLNTIRLDAIGEGAWSANLTARVEEGTITNTVTVTISLRGGTTAVPDEVYRNVGLDSAGLVSIQTIVDAINNRPSSLVTATNLAAATTGVTARPAVIGATVLSTGTDDTAGATSSVVSAMLTTAFGPELGPGMVALPGYLHTDVAAAMITHCVANKRWGVVAGTFGENEASITSAEATIQGLANGKHILVAYPWVSVPNGQGGNKWIEPTGYYTGVESRISERIGIWQEPGGIFGADEAGYIVGLATKVDDAMNNRLEAVGVSALIMVAGQVWVGGWRNSGTDTNFTSMADIAEEYAFTWLGAVALRPVNWAGIDDKHRTLNRAIGIIEGIAVARQVAGAYHAGDNDPGYSVDGTEDLLGQSIRVRAGIRRRPSAKLIYLDVTASAINAPV